MTGAGAVRLDGTKTARAIRDEVARGVEDFRARAGRPPGLSVVLVGEHPASQVYVRGKEKAATEAGFASAVLRLPASAGEGAILAAVHGLNADRSVDGILVQLPLPEGVDAHRVIEAIDPEKDVDGFHPVNAGRLLIGLPGFVPATPSGIVELLKRHGVPLAGRRAVVLGRSNIVGKPMAVLLLREDCTVTVAHSKTRDLEAVCAEADVLVAAIGRAGFVRGSFVRPGAAVVDVGMNTLTTEDEVRAMFGDDARRLETLAARGAVLCGDVHPLEVGAKAGWLSPVPGGVGPLTIAMLLANTLQAARRAAGAERVPPGRPPLRVGLSGGLASGKSTVAEILRDLGAFHVDADAIARDLIRPGGRAHDAVVARFGRGILGGGGEIDRKALADLVFGDAGARADLNAIVHPLVREEIDRRIAEHARGDAPAPVAIVDAALLVESGIHRSLDALVVTSCPPEVQRKRAVARGGMTAGEAEARIAAQAPLAAKLAAADYVIDTSGTLEETRRRTEEVWRALLGRRKGG